MKTVVLLSCVATKAPTPQPAEQLYQSPLFEKSLAYGKSLHPDDMFILSAKHYLLPLQKVIAPYNKTLNEMDADQKKEWSEQIVRMLKQHGFNPERDKFIILAGSSYRKYLEPMLKNVEVPVEGLRIGQQMQWYNKQLKKIKETVNQIKTIIYEAIRKSFK